MKQLVQNRKDGAMELLEVPAPTVGPDSLLVRLDASVISAGTEGRSVKDARAGYVQKARARPKEVKQVIDTARKIGLTETYKLVMDKLNAPSPLGYSAAGEVIAVGDNVRGFAVGDRVACGGQGAVHAEIVSVLPSLTVKLPPEVPAQSAAFTTIGSIALQGVRQADVSLGETCAVIGLGLLGQLTVQILRAAGVRTIGFDIEADKVQLALANGADCAFLTSDEGALEHIDLLTRGHGVDAVIITAATNSTDPVNLAGKISRMKAAVVSVGRVNTAFDRDAYYLKELDLRMSCSYGPGRYDSEYEEKGRDYPIGYVRWTENRNMQAFVHLLAENRVDLDSLITHRFAFAEAIDAYDMIADRSEPFLGIVLEYAGNADEESVSVSFAGSRPRAEASASVGFVGAGSFAQKFLLPQAQERAALIAVATAHGHTATHIASKYGFRRATSDGHGVIADPDVNTVFIATRHDSHAEYVLAALRAGKHVFVEKPLCLTPDELRQIRDEYAEHDVHLMVGYNRRFARLVGEITEGLSPETPKSIMMRVNLGPIDSSHWTMDPEVGGGRIVGELCHFVDLAMHIAGGAPESIVSFGLDESHPTQTTASTMIRFKNGSIASLNYYANGNAALDKEYIEVHASGRSAVLEDFRKLRLYGRSNRVIKGKMDKGHAEEVRAFLDAVVTGAPCPIPVEEIFASSQLTFDVLASMKSGSVISY